MKRFLCILMAALMVGSAILAVVLAALPVNAQTVTVYDQYSLVSKGKGYTTSKYFTATGGMPYTNVDGKELTDGVTTTSDLYGTTWVAFDYRLEAPMYATIDLGSKVDSLGKFRVYLVASADSGIDRPVKCDFLISDDGKNFTKAGEGVYESDGEKYSWCTLQLEKPVSARYVKADFGEATLSGVFCFCGEFEVYKAGPREVDPSTLPGMELRSDSFLKADGDFLLNAHIGNKVSYLKQCIRANEDVVAYSKNGKKLGDDDVMSTGAYFAKEYQGAEVDRLYIVVSGDCNGDGKITVVDYILGKRIAANKVTLDAPFKKAKTFDVLVKNHILGVKDMFADKPHNKLTIDKVPGDPSVPPEISAPEPDEYAVHTMSIKKNSDSLYTMSTTASDGKPLTFTFYKTAWGTMNMGDLTVGNDKLAGGSTDWEYVFRAKGVQNDGTTGKYGLNDAFIGGNHGQETLKSFKVYNGETGEELKLSNGQSANNLKKIKVIEETTIFLTEPGTTDIMNVTRTYMLYGETITLDCDFEVIKDAELSLSYMCMFPVKKTVGQYIKFNYKDGTSKVIETLEVGKADYSGTQHKGNAALECLIWGKKNTKYAFTVEVTTEEGSVDGFKNDFKTSYWDMNTSHNKLYFSRFPDSGYQKVAKGTTWHTQSVWTLFCLEEDK